MVIVSGLLTFWGLFLGKGLFFTSYLFMRDRACTFFSAVMETSDAVNKPAQQCNFPVSEESYRAFSDVS